MLLFRTSLFRSFENFDSSLAKTKNVTNYVLQKSVLLLFFLVTFCYGMRNYNYLSISLFLFFKFFFNMEY